MAEPSGVAGFSARNLLPGVVSTVPAYPISYIYVEYTTIINLFRDIYNCEFSLHPNIVYELIHYDLHSYACLVVVLVLGYVEAVFPLITRVSELFGI